MMVDDVVCSRMRMYQEPMDIIEILTVSDAATVQRMSRRFLRVVANRTHHNTPYRQCFRWRVLLPLKSQLKIYSPGNLTRGRRRHCPLSIPEKKNQYRKEIPGPDSPERLSRISSVSFSSPLSTSLLLQLYSGSQRQGTMLECILGHGRCSRDS